LLGVVIEGLTRQMIVAGRLNDEQAFDPRRFESALTAQPIGA
jgi:hypothetical protein